MIPFDQFVAYKKIAVLGPRDISLYDIREYQLIVQLNNHWLKRRGRCDILYHNGGMDPTPMLNDPEFKPSYVFCLGFGSMSSIFRDNAARKGYVYQGISRSGTPDDMWFSHLMADITDPLIGTVAWYHLLRFSPLQVHLWGMDLYRQSPRRKEITHDLKAQAALLLKYYHADPRLRFCQELIEGIKDTLKIPNNLVSATETLV